MTEQDYSWREELLAVIGENKNPRFRAEKCHVLAREYAMQAISDSIEKHILSTQEHNESDYVLSPDQTPADIYRMCSDYEKCLEDLKAMEEIVGEDTIKKVVNEKVLSETGGASPLKILEIYGTDLQKYLDHAKINRVIGRACDEAIKAENAERSVRLLEKMMYSGFAFEDNSCMRLFVKDVIVCQMKNEPADTAKVIKRIKECHYERYLNQKDSALRTAMELYARQYKELPSQADSRGQDHPEKGGKTGALVERVEELVSTLPSGSPGPRGPFGGHVTKGIKAVSKSQ